MSDRVKRAALAGTGLLALGLAYAAFVTATGYFLPCPFRALTGLLCPGCGVTHLGLALLRLDFPAAWAANPGLFLALLPLGVLAALALCRYLTDGRVAFPGAERVLAWALIVWLLIWGAVRNVLPLAAG